MEMQPFFQQVTGIELSRDGTYMVAGGNENRAIVWDITNPRSFKFLFAVSHLAAVKALHFCPWSDPPTLLATAGGLNDCSVKIWHVPSGTLLRQFLTSGQVTSVTWSKTCRQLAVTFGYRYNTSLGAATIYKYPEFTVLAHISQKELRVFSSAVSTDQSKIAVSSSDGTVILFPLWKQITLDEGRVGLSSRSSGRPQSPTHTASDFESSIISLMEGIDEGFALR